MTFLAPMSALAASAIAVPLLVILYLLKLRRRPARVSSTLFWQSSAHDLQANIPFRWPRFSWLFLLHLVILGLLLAAYGRPAIDTHAGSGSRVVILLDRSASMSATDGPNGLTRFQLAKARCRELIAQALSAPDASVALVTFAAAPATNAGFSTSAAALGVALGAVEPTDQPADLAAALTLVETLIPEQTEESSPGQAALVVLVSDGSFEPTARLTMGGGRIRYVRVSPQAPPGGPDNIGIIAFSARRDYEDPARTLAFVRLVNSSDQPRDASLSLMLNDQVVERRAIHLPARAPAPATSDTSATFDLDAPRGGTLTIQVDRSDVLLSDNSASLVLGPATRPRILLVTADAAPEQTEVSPRWLLGDVLSELGPTRFRMVTAREYERLADAGAVDADLVVFHSVMPVKVPPVPTLSFAAGLPMPGATVELPSQSTLGSYVIAWARGHPVLRDVSLDSVYITGAGWIKRSHEQAGKSSVVTTSLADGVDGPLIASAQDGQIRRLIVAFDPAFSNWPLSPGFPVFIASAVEYLTLRGDDAAGRFFTTAQPVDARARAGATKVMLRGPATLEAMPTRGASDDHVSFGLVERAGVYAVEPAGTDAVVAVNLVNAAESMLGSTEELEISGRVAAADAPRLPREIWTRFVLAAAGLLLLEWLLYAARTRVSSLNAADLRVNA